MTADVLRTYTVDLVEKARAGRLDPPGLMLRDTVTARDITLIAASWTGKPELGE